jgi:pyridoxal phosphate enzyme (YggS family)
MGSIRENIEGIEERIRRACDDAGRRREEVRLMAVSKLQPDELIREAIDLGMRFFGESRVQETKARRTIFPDDADIHLIGHLQRNKAKDAVDLYTAIESIDAVRTVDALANARREDSPEIDLYIEANTSGEESKQGVHGYDELRILAEKIDMTPGFVLRGLMTIGPLSGDETAVRRAFGSLRDMRNRLEDETGRSVPELSMGMSGDLEAAILEGSTIVRIGTALFGHRVY